MNRRLFLSLLFFSPFATAHSPWGQYTVYRQKHLLIMSSKADPNSYPYSEILVNAINKEEPTARARPARARDLERCYSLFLTDQMQFMLLPRDSSTEMREASGAFRGRQPLPMKTVYEFDNLILSVRDDMDANIIRIVTYSILERLSDLPRAAEPSKMLNTKHVHVESLTAITTFLANNAKG